ncbi:helix-turn-helix domain-containing protein [Collinsella sp. LCP21S3_A3]|uniref:helix-turn-helix domain-containing protein n=1 Tax=Bacillati TaxID=1783272 RepID=UPI003F8CE7AC
MTTARAPMTEHDLDAWLSDTTATPTQRAELLAADAALCETIPDDAEPGTGSPEFMGAAKLVLGDATLADLAATLLAARIAEREAMAELQGAIVAAHQRGVSVMELARQSGLTRRTVYRTLSR